MRPFIPLDHQPAYGFSQCRAVIGACENIKMIARQNQTGPYIHLKALLPDRIAFRQALNWINAFAAQLLLHPRDKAALQNIKSNGHAARGAERSRISQVHAAKVNVLDTTLQSGIPANFGKGQPVAEARDRTPPVSITG